MTPSDLAARGDHAGLWDWNLTTNRVHFSPRWAAMAGADERSLGNTPDDRLTRVHPDDAADLRRRLEERLAGRPSEFDLPHPLRHADGTYRWTSCRGVVVRAEAGQAVRVMGCHSDVTPVIGRSGARNRRPTGRGWPGSDTGPQTSLPRAALGRRPFFTVAAASR